MAGVKARTFKKRIVSLPAAQWNQEYSNLVGFIHAKIAMAVVRANTLLLCRGQLKRPKWIPFVNGSALECFPGRCEL